MLCAGGVACSRTMCHMTVTCPVSPVRTALLAIIGFMPTESGGAVGALDYPEEEKKRLARL